MSETFEEWYNSEIDKIPDDIEFGFNEILNQTTEMVRAAWNHQQKKIDALEKKLEVSERQRQFDFDNSVKLDAKVSLLENKLAEVVEENKKFKKFLIIKSQTEVTATRSTIDISLEEKEGEK